MHGGGSPDGAKIVIRGTADIPSKVELARSVAGVEEVLEDPKKKRR